MIRLGIGRMQERISIFHHRVLGSALYPNPNGPETKRYTRALKRISMRTLQLAIGGTLSASSAERL